MIDLYSMATPNGFKIHIMLEECKLEYKAHHIDIGKGDQFNPIFLEISPNNKIPAIVDNFGPSGKKISLFESGAILIYLASKVNKFLGHSDFDKFTVLQWLMFQMGSVGPMLGQSHHFRIYSPEKIEYAIQRYTKEANRIYNVIENQLSKSKFLAGENYSIADISCFPWIRSWEKQGVKLEDFKNIKKWFGEINDRPAVQKGLSVLASLRKPLISESAKENLFGSKQYRKH